MLYRLEQTQRLASSGTVQFAVVTDGIVWIVYFRDPAEQEPLRSVLRLDLSDAPVEQAADDLALLLGRRTILDGQAATHAQRLIQAQQAQQLEQAVPRALLELIGEADDLLVQLIRERLQEELHLSAGADDIAAVVKRINANAAATETAAALEYRPERAIAPAVADQPEAEPRTRYRSTWEGALPPVAAFSLFGREERVHTYAALLAAVASRVYERHSDTFDRALSLRGRTRDHYSRNPQSMYAPKPIGRSPYFVETKLNSRQAVDRCHELIRHFGYDPEELLVFFD